MVNSRTAARPLALPAPPTLEAFIQSPVGVILEPDARRYVGWLWRKDGTGWTKPPFNLSPNRSPTLASVDNEHTWMSLGDAWLGWHKRQFDGIGIVLLRDRPLRRLDVDHVRDPRTGTIAPPALELVRRFPLLVTLSVSGTGLAGWLFGPPLEDTEQRGKRKLVMTEWPRIGDHDPAVELLSHGCYSCIGTVLVDR